MGGLGWDWEAWGGQEGHDWGLLGFSWGDWEWTGGGLGDTGIQFGGVGVELGVPGPNWVNWKWIGGPRMNQLGKLGPPVGIWGPGVSRYFGGGLGGSWHFWGGRSCPSLSPPPPGAATNPTPPVCVSPTPPSVPPVSPPPPGPR